jgi:hypothetical protein
VHLPALGEGRFFAVDRDAPSGDRVVLERPAQKAGRAHRVAVVGEPGRARLCELDHLGELAPLLALADRGEEPDRHLCLGSRPLDERAEHGGRVHGRIGVRHGEDRAVPARSRGARAGDEVLLVLPPGGAEVDVGIDERRREYLAVASRRRLQACDHALLDSDGQGLVDAFRGVDDPHGLEGHIVLAAVLGEQNHATSSISATLTSTGPCVRRS